MRVGDLAVAALLGNLFASLASLAKRRARLVLFQRVALLLALEREPARDDGHRALVVADRAVDRVARGLAGETPTNKPHVAVRVAQNGAGAHLFDDGQLVRHLVLEVG